METSAKRETPEHSLRMINGVSPGMKPTTDTTGVGHCQTEMSPASSTRQTPTFSGQELAGAGTTLDAVACMGPGRDSGDGSAYFKHKTGTECRTRSTTRVAPAAGRGASRSAVTAAANGAAHASARDEDRAAGQDERPRRPQSPAGGEHLLHRGRDLALVPGPWGGASCAPCGHARQGRERGISNDFHPPGCYPDRGSCNGRAGQRRRLVPL